ncbi:MAG: ClpP family protease [Butyrivibrio sp.]
MSEEMNNSIDKYGMSESGGVRILCITGEIEGHDNLSKGEKATRYEHMLPLLANLEYDREVKGILFLINTMGGDVSAGLALAEMIAGMKTPTVSLVIGDSHSIGVPIAVSADYSFIVPSATVLLHPVRMNGIVPGTEQTYRQFQSIQDRIIHFISAHSHCPENEVEAMMMENKNIARDLGTILVGKEAVEAGIIDETGTVSDAFEKLDSMIK